MSPPAMKVSSSSGRFAWSSSRVATVYDGPPRAHLDVGHLEAVVLRRGEAAQLQAHLGARVVGQRLVRRCGHGHEGDAVELELLERLPRAHEVRDVRGIERPPEDSERSHYGLMWLSPSTTYL